MLTTIDNITIVLCVIGIFWISRTMGKRSADMESFYHANKSLPWSLAVGTIAETEPSVPSAMQHPWVSRHSSCGPSAPTW